jgi:hypothetical protein
MGTKEQNDGNDKKNEQLKQLEKNLQYTTTTSCCVGMQQKELVVSSDFFEELNRQTLADQRITISSHQ